VNRAVVLDAPGRIEVRMVPLATAGPGEVVVRAAWAGICGSDVDLRDGNRPLPFARYPIVPGHEWSGIVETVGDGVDRSLLGNPVVGENIGPCSRCTPCGRGDAQGCESGYDEAGFTIDGAWAEQVVVPASLLRALPATADLRSAAGIEPAACAAEALRRAELTRSSRVAIVGGGTIGLLCAQLIRELAGELVVVDQDPSKGGVAERCGATYFVGPESAAAGLDSHFDLVIEAAGATGTANLALKLAQRGGLVVLCGISPADDTISTLAVVSKRLEVASVFGASRGAWIDAVDAFKDQRLDPGLLVTHELGLDEAADALDLVARRPRGVGKVLLRPGPAAGAYERPRRLQDGATVECRRTPGLCAPTRWTDPGGTYPERMR
jgi:2-desacetyl-2-hydroxyethyl bacteriochlorophyllide A dehydrogenase